MKLVPGSAIRPYRPADLTGVRTIYADDEFARPQLLRKYPRLGEYLADEVSYYYTRFEPESILVVEVDGRIVGALLGAVDTHRQERFYNRHTRPFLLRRGLIGAYGLPLWLFPFLRTEWVNRGLVPHPVDLMRYPAHLHIGILPAWRRQGLGTELMAAYANYLRRRNISGYHLYASSFHPLGVAFYRKMGLADLGRFEWRFHTGYEWLTVTETIFGQCLG